MKILLIYPKHPDTFWSFKHALKFVSKKALHPPLGLMTVAAMLPEGWEKKLVDMNVEPLKEEAVQWADYVFISAMAVQRESANEVIDRCKKAGVPIVAGGPLFTASHEDFKSVDHFVLNDAEITLPRFLADLLGGEPKPLYTSDVFPSMRKTPVPLWELIQMKKYVSMCIQYSRGCPFNCEFCDVTVLFGRKVRTKSKDQIIEELESLYLKGWRGGVFFVDDNFIGNKENLKNSLLPAIIDWMDKRRHPFRFSTEASINLSDDETLMQLMVKASFDSVFIGIETPDDNSLAECNKVQNRKRDLIGCVKKIQRFGLRVRGGFIVGFDHDQPSIFERQVEFIQNSRIITAMVGLLNAPRGTRLYQRIAQEGRLLGNVYGDNTDFTTNLIPQMGYEKLVSGYQRIIQGIYSPKPYYERVKEFLKEYRPLEKHRFHFYFGLVRLHPGYPGAIFKSMWSLGIRDRERVHFWKLFFWSLFRRPRILPMAITYSIYGFHFRKIFESYLR